MYHVVLVPADQSSSPVAAFVVTDDPPAGWEVVESFQSYREAVAAATDYRAGAEQTPQAGR